MKINPKQVEAVSALPGPQRYSHFIKVAADQRKVWGLFSEGWALYGTDDGKEAFPIWPASEYASCCNNGSWAEYQPREIDLDDLFEKLMPSLEKSKTLLAIFPTSTDKGVTPDFKLLESDIRQELSRIE